MTSEIEKFPTRVGLDMMVSGLDPNRPLPIPAPIVDRMWDKQKAVPPQWKDAPFRDYAGRYLPGGKPTLWDRFFGSQDKLAQDQLQVHPCHEVASRVHTCLDRNADKGDLKSDFCRSIVNVFEGCLREYKM